MLVLNLLGYSGRILLLLGLFLTVNIFTAFAQTVEKNSLAQTNIIANYGNFTLPESLLSFPVLSTLTTEHGQGPIPISVLSQFYPLLQEKLSSLEFEQVQSIIIPGGILDPINKVIYLENGNNDIVMLDLDSGKTIRRIKNVCNPIAVIDNSLLALSKTSIEAKASYALLMLGGKNVLGYKAHWSPILLPDWLDLPLDGERQKFVFNVHCYNSILSVTWQASQKMMFPNAFSWIMPMSQPSALQGCFSCNLKTQNIVSQSIKESDNDFLGYLTISENNLPAQIVLSEDTIATNTYDSYVFSLVRVYPPEHNISKAGVVGKRELQVRDLNTGKILWTHTLPATFIPLSF